MLSLSEDAHGSRIGVNQPVVIGNSAFGGNLGTEDP